MKRHRLLQVAGLAFLGLGLIPQLALAQQKTLREQLVGMWELVGAENTGADGTKSLPFGPNPKGIAVLDGNGRFVILNMTSTLPKVASNNRATATPEENKAIVSGSLGLYGTWTANEAAKELAYRIEASTFSNWVGQEHKRPVLSVTADEISWANPASSVGVSNTTVLRWKRMK